MQLQFEEAAHVYNQQRYEVKTRRRSTRGVSELVKMGFSQLFITTNLPINSNHGVFESLFLAAHELKIKAFLRLESPNLSINSNHRVTKS